MANRTLRRAYTEADGTNHGSEEVSGVDESAINADNGGVPDIDSLSNGDGKEPGPEFDGSSSIGYVTIDPASLGDYIDQQSSADNGNGDRARKQRSDAGKPRGTRGRPRKQAEIPTLVTIHNLFQSLASVRFKDFELDKEEKEKIDAALTNFAAYHELPLMSPKTASTIELLNALGMVYGPRIYTANVKRKLNAASKRAKKANPFVMSQTAQQEAVQ